MKDDRNPGPHRGPGDILLIGEDPGRNGNPRRPLVGGATGRRLTDLCGIPDDGTHNGNLRAILAFLAVFETRNLFSAPHAGPGWYPLEEAARSARDLITERYRPLVVCCGRRVWTAVSTACRFDGSAGDVPPMRWIFFLHGINVCWIPHPSGRCRWYNDAGNYERARRFMTRLFETRTGGDGYDG